MSDFSFSDLNKEDDYDSPLTTIQIQESQIQLDQSELEKIIQASIQKPQDINIVDDIEEGKIDSVLNPTNDNIPDRLKILTKKAQKEEDEKIFSFDKLSLDDILKGFSKTLILLLRRGIYFFDYHKNDPDQERFIYFGIIILLLSLILLF